MKMNYNDNITLTALEKIGMSDAMHDTIAVTAKKTFVFDHNTKIEAGTLFYLTGISCIYDRKEDYLKLKIKSKFPEKDDFALTYWIPCKINLASYDIMLDTDDCETTLFSDIITKADEETEKLLMSLHTSYNEYETNKRSFSDKQLSVGIVLGVVCVIAILTAICTGAALIFVNKGHLTSNNLLITTIISLVMFAVSGIGLFITNAMCYNKSKKGKKLSKKIDDLFCTIHEKDHESVKNAKNAEADETISSKN